jgi:membrane-associated phospholipid phosphatase
MSASSYAAGRPAPRPALRLRLRLRGWCAQLALFAAAYAVYGLSRYVVVGDLATAQDHARWIVDLQRALGVDVERDVQRALDAGAVRWLLNNVYLAAQLVVVPGTLVALYRRAPRVYRALRDTVLATWLLAVPVYALFPVAPPRLAEMGFVDTITAGGAVALDSRLTTSLYNPIAAVPSLHAGFALAVSVALVVVARRPLTRALCALWAPLIALAVVATGNHFVFDIAAGLVASAAGYGVTLWLAARSASGPRRPSPALGARLAGA